MIGGASRLFRHFLKLTEPKQVISYADRSWSTGDLYEKLGFKLSGVTKPGFWYVNRDKRYHRSSFQKKRLVHMGYDPNLTGHQIMESLGYSIVYDCGSYRYRFIT